MGGIGLLALKGGLRGFFREAFGLLAVAGGVGASVLLGDAAAREAAARWVLSPLVARVVGHAVLFLVPYFLLQAAGYLLHRVGRAVFLGGADRVAGALLGAAAGVLLGGAVLDLAADVPWARGWVSDSELAAPLAGAYRQAAGWAAGLWPRG